MNTYEVRELHEIYRPDRFAVHKDGLIVAKFEHDLEAYKFMNERIEKPSLYCNKCCAHLMVKGVCKVFCRNKEC